MSDSMRRAIGWGVAIASIVVMVVGLLPESVAADPDQRHQELSERIACPLCDGQSLAESGSEVANDLQVILREQIDAGLTDAEIYDFFAARYGEHVLLDPPLNSWGLVLWVLPLLVLVAGAWVIWKRLTT